MGEEECDDGNTNDNDLCSSSCLINQEKPLGCGNGIIEEGEECDKEELNNQTCENLGLGVGILTCTQFCTLNTPDCGGEFCGNGLLEGAEQCDNGDDNSDVVPDACRTDCTLPRCGDGAVDSDEQCDDGNTTPSDGCTEVCQLEPILTNGAPRQIQVGDGNGDGREDIFFVIGRSIFVSIRNESGVFEKPVQIDEFEDIGVQFVAIKVKNINLNTPGDELLVLVGRPDLIFINFDRLIAYTMTNVDGSFEPFVELSLGGDFVSLDAVSYDNTTLFYVQQNNSDVLVIDAALNGSIFALPFSGASAGTILANNGFLEGDTGEGIFFVNEINEIGTDSIAFAGFSHQSFNTLASPENFTLQNPTHLAITATNVFVVSRPFARIANVLSSSSTAEIIAVVDIDLGPRIFGRLMIHSNASGVGLDVNIDIPETSSLEFAAADTDANGIAELFFIAGDNLSQRVESDVFSTATTVSSGCNAGIVSVSTVDIVSDEGEEVVVGCSNNQIRVLF
jgi:cysteine-rich repeat protein